MLKVSDNRRFLVRENGDPFFYLGDTAWCLFHRLKRDEADAYLENRAGKGFTVIQAVVLAEHGGLIKPNANGDSEFIDGDIRKPNEAYFKHIDCIVDKAAALGLHVGMLPTWGDKVGVNYWGDGPAGFINEENAEYWGEFLGTRYRKAPLIWILGGDRPGDGNEEIWRRMVRGLKQGDGGTHLVTYHPMGQDHSATWFHNDEWLDFNMVQTGHSAFRDSWRDIQEDYSRTPPKPCMDGEPGYEDHPSHFDPKQGYMDDYHVRLSAYWALFAGAHGHTYGCNDIWQFFDPERNPPKGNARTHWRNALDLPGSFHVGFARRLLESRPYLTRIPDQGAIREGQVFHLGHVRVTRDGTKGRNDATYLMAYFSAHREVKLDVGRIAASRVRQWWFDPRTCETRDAGMSENPGVAKFAPPTNYFGQDWILVIDDASKNYPTPGLA